MKCLYLQEFFLSLSQKLNALLVVANDHSSENLVALTLAFDLKVCWPFLFLIEAQVLCLETELEV